MTEAEWVVWDDPTRMLKLVGGVLSVRKRRLFACACCRDIWEYMEEEGSRKAVEVAERFADGEAIEVELTAADAGSFAAEKAESTEAGQWAATAARTTAAGPALWEVQCQAAWIADKAAWAVRGIGDRPGTQAVFLRDICGNPFHRPGDIAPEWQQVDTLSLARAAYEERLLPSGNLDPARLAVLSDALEEAGCTDAELLTHLRSPGPHVRGCWALDLVLGKG